MIAYLTGEILKIMHRSVIVKTEQVGYLVSLPESKIQDIKETDTIELFIYTHVREDTLDLYGFRDYKELQFFKQLLTISGVGPKTAQEITSLPLKELKLSIIDENPALISSVPKVGKKIASRIILELKNKIDLDDLGDLSNDSTRAHTTLKDINEDVYVALEKFGYTRKEIQKSLNTLPENTTDPEEIIKFFLKHA